MCVHITGVMNSVSSVSKSRLHCEDPELEITELTFNKVTRESLKVGYREGADEARQQNYQQYFDKGYEQGFQSGLRLGALKAKQRLGCFAKEDVALAKELSVSRQGMCILCEEKELLEAPLEDIKHKQAQKLKDFDKLFTK